MLFSKDPVGGEIFTAVSKAIAGIGPHQRVVSKSQIAFRNRRTFAIVWRPSLYLRGRCAPLVLTLTLPKKIPSRRWKQVAEPSPGRFSHHLEVWSTEDVDSEVKRWLKLSRKMAA